MKIWTGRKKICAALFIVLFAAGVFGNISIRCNFLPAPNPAHKPAVCSVSGGNLESDRSEGSVSSEKYVPARAPDGIDDFRITPHSGGINTHARQQPRQAAFLFLTGTDEVYAPFAAPGIKKDRETHIWLFYVVSFLHRTDGKKKTCFV